MSKQLVAFDNVASTLLLVWTGLNWTDNLSIYSDLLDLSAAVVISISLLLNRSKSGFKTVEQRKSASD